MLFSRYPTWPKTSVYHVNVIVVSAASGCDVTNCATTLQGFTASEGTVGTKYWTTGSLVALRNIYKSTLAHMCRPFNSSNPPYPYSVTRIVTRRHCQMNSSRSALFPYQASISVCGIVHVPALSSRYHSNSHQS